MIFLKDVFQTTDEIKQNEEKFKSAVEASFHQLDTLVRPYLSEAQNETLSEILERLVASVAEHSFQKRRQHSRQGPMCNSKTKTALPAPTGKAAIGTGMMCDVHSHSYNITEQGV